MMHTVAMSIVFRRSRTGLAYLALMAAQLVGIILWITYVMTWVDWWGGIGLLVGALTVPGIVIFPFLYWIVENEFPWNYFSLWLGIAVLYLLSALASSE